MWSVCSRRSESSIAIAMYSAEPFGTPGAIFMSKPLCPNFVASTTRSRRPLSATPMSVSLRPGSLPP